MPNERSTRDPEYPCRSALVTAGLLVNKTNVSRDCSGQREIGTIENRLADEPTGGFNLLSRQRD